MVILIGMETHHYNLSTVIRKDTEIQRPCCVIFLCLVFILLLLLSLSSSFPNFNQSSLLLDE